MKRSSTLGRSFCLLLLGLAFSLAQGQTKEGYVTHEWGTFTSLQAPDGTLLSWDAGAPTDLPKFVYNWTNSETNLSPAGMLAFNKSKAALQRMETPVVYFYGNGEQAVDVTVQFPKGTITEWYPHFTDLGPSVITATGKNGIENNKHTKESLIRWQATILSKKESATIQLPSEKSDNHYFAARETDAAVVKVAGPYGKGTESEKFLFYRGIGNFGTPLKVTGEGEKITVSNTGPQPLQHLFIYTVKNGSGQFIAIERLASGEMKTIEFTSKSQPLDKLVPQISRELVKGLRKQGLYEPEARAMVKTWKASWLEEEGTRVLYTLPEKWTEEILPMTLNPKPRELVRVMVGRAELIRPEIEQQLVELLTQSRDGKKDVSHELATLLKPHGRFGHSIFLRALSKVDPERKRPELYQLYSMITPVK